MDCQLQSLCCILASDTPAHVPVCLPPDAGRSQHNGGARGGEEMGKAGITLFLPYLLSFELLDAFACDSGGSNGPKVD